MKEQEELYIRGFNNGYILKKFEPTLLAAVLNNLSPTTPYLDGLLSGKDQFELEKFEKQVEDLDDLRNQSVSRENDLEKDR